MALQIRTEVHPPQAHIVFTIDKNRPPRAPHIENSLLKFVQKNMLTKDQITFPLVWGILADFRILHDIEMKIKVV
jgi:hypothetical protein